MLLPATVTAFRALRIGTRNVCWRCFGQVNNNARQPHIPTKRLTSILQSLSRKKNHAKVYPEALKIYDRAKEAQLPLDDFFFNALLGAIGLQSKQTAHAFAIYEEMRSMGIKPTAHIYTTMLAVCSKAKDTDRAESLFNEANAVLPESSMLPEYSALLNVYAECGNVDKCERLFDRMKRLFPARNKRSRGARQPPSSAPRTEIDSTEYSKLIKCYINAGQFNKAFSVYKDVESNLSIQFTPAHCSSIINCLIEQQQYKLAEAMYADMLRLHFTGGNSELYNVMLKLYITTDDLSKVVHTFQQLLKSANPDFATFNTLLKYFAEKERITECKLVLDAMHQTNKNIHSSSYNIFLNLCGRLGDVDSTLEIFERQSKSSDNSPKYTTTPRHISIETTTTTEYTEPETDDSVTRLIGHAQKVLTHLQWPSIRSMYDNVLHTMLSHGHINQALEFVKQMRERFQLIPNYAFVINYCLSERQDTATAIQLFYESCADGVLLRSRDYLPLASAVRYSEYNSAKLLNDIAVFIHKANHAEQENFRTRTIGG